MGLKKCKHHLPFPLELLGIIRINKTLDCDSHTTEMCPNVYNRKLVSPFTPKVPAHLSIPSITGRGTRTVACGICSLTPHPHPYPYDLWIGLDASSNSTLICNLLSKVWLMGRRGGGGGGGGGALVFICIDWWVKWWPALSRHRLYCTGCCKYLLEYEMCNVWATFSNIAHLPRMFPLLFEKRIGLVTMDLFVSYLHFKLRIFSWSVSGLGNESSCDVWGGECTIWLLCGGLIWSLCF